MLKNAALRRKVAVGRPLLRYFVAILCILNLAGPLHAAPSSNEAAPLNGGATAAGNESAAAPGRSGALSSVGNSAGRIATQPVRDVGVAKTKFPPPLVEAAQNPYALKGIKTCKQIAAAHLALSDVLGPDLTAGQVAKENRAGKLAEAGGQTIVNSLIPFRGLVREISGAAPAQRRLNRAIDAGYARRGFLRGIHQQRGCKTKLR